MEYCRRISGVHPIEKALENQFFFVVYYLTEFTMLVGMFSKERQGRCRHKLLTSWLLMLVL